ncbi:MAG: hypothetical protein SPK42_02460, partial [Eubacteriales bacterium]|nr:hypothetical protein [Eubacteriales bacterium]
CGFLVILSLCLNFFEADEFPLGVDSCNVFFAVHLESESSVRFIESAVLKFSHYYKTKNNDNTSNCRCFYFSESPYLFSRLI